MAAIAVCSMPVVKQEGTACVVSSVMVCRDDMDRHEIIGVAMDLATLTKPGFSRGDPLVMLFDEDGVYIGTGEEE